MKSKDLLIALAIFVVVIMLGSIYIKNTTYGNIESSIIYLAGVLATGAFWIGRK